MEKIFLSWTEWLEVNNKKITTMNCGELSNEYEEWLYTSIQNLNKVIGQIKILLYKTRDEYLNEIKEPRDVITNNPDSDVNIINNRFALIFDSIKSIEENYIFLETRYGKSGLP